MKNMLKRIISLILAWVVVLSGISIKGTETILGPIDVQAASYSSDYREWSQGASDDEGLRKWGCWVVAQAKLLYETNVDRSASFNPDSYFQWQKTYGYIDSGYYQTNGSEAPVAYARQKGKTLNYLGFWSASDDQLWYNINAGYKTILRVKNGGHYVLLANDISKEKGVLYCYESYSTRTSVAPRPISDYSGTIEGGYVYSVGGVTTPKFEGHIDYAEGGPGTVHISGWAMDMNDMSKSIEVHVYIGGSAELSGQPGVEAFVVPANLERVDVGNAYPGAGNYHGYSVTLNTSLVGQQSVHVYAYNPESGMAAYMGITTVNIAEKVTPESISLDKTNVTLTSIGQTEQLTATISPDTATDKSVTWTSSNERVATVDNTGLVKAVGAGTATITATTVDGNKTATCTVTVKIKTELVIKTHPSNKYVKTDAYTTFTVAADGEGLAYQWQYSADGKNWTNSGMTGAKTTSLKVQGTEARNGQKYRCVITDKYGAKVTSNAAVLYVLGIKTQPSDRTVDEGDFATFSVKAYGNGLKYQWQYKAVGGSTWSNSSASGSKTAHLTVEALEKRDGQQYRCIVTDAGGNSVTSNAATLNIKASLAITSQPVSKTVEEGESAVFKVVVSGSSLKYQWQFSKDGGKTWGDSGMSGAKTASLTVVGTAARNGQQYRCVVTDGAGNTVTSTGATLTVKPATVALAIVTNPSNKTVEEGASAVFKVVAQGEGLKYQWQFSKDNGKTWGNSGMAGAKTASLTVVGTAARNGQQYRCVVTDGAGNKVTSKAATLTVKAATVTLAIVTNPSNKTVEEGASAVFKVAAQGEGLKYQWQFSKDNGKTWGNSGMTGAKTASLTVVGTAARNGQQYRCVVTDGAGNTVTSKAATLTVKAATAALAIVTNPSNQTVKAGVTATFTVVAQGEGLTYQWQFKAANATEWKNSGMTGAKTASLSIVGTTARNGQQYRCVVTDGSGNVVTSEVASLVVTE